MHDGFKVAILRERVRLKTALNGRQHYKLIQVFVQRQTLQVLIKWYTLCTQPCKVFYANNWENTRHNFPHSSAHFQELVQNANYLMAYNHLDILHSLDHLPRQDPSIPSLSMLHAKCWEWGLGTRIPSSQLLSHVQWNPSINLRTSKLRTPL